MSYRRLVEALFTGQPYFGMALRAFQGPPVRHKYMLPVVKAVMKGAGGRIEILEIGSWAGASAISWAWALNKLEVDGRITCVDPWRPYFDLGKEKSLHYQRMNRAAGSGMIYRLFRHNVSSSGFSDVIRARVGESRKVLPKLAPKRFHVVYVDGSHAFEDVLFDLQQAKRLIRPGGIICGDDLELQRKDLDSFELEAAAATGQDFVFAVTAQAHYHPGVTSAVGQEFGEVNVWDGLWAVRFSGEGPAKMELEVTDSELPPHIASEAITMEGDTPTYYTISSHGSYFALAKELGPPDVAAELLSDDDLPPFVFTGETLEEVRRKVEQQEQQRVPAKSDGAESELHSSPELVSSYRDYNLVRFKGKTYGLRQSLGPVNVTVGDAVMEARYGDDDVMIGESLDRVKARIDATEARREVRALARDARAFTDALRARLDAMENSQQIGTEIAVVREESTRTAISLQEFVERTQAGFEDLGAALEAVRAEAAGMSAESQAEVQRQVDEMQQAVRGFQAQLEHGRLEAQNAVVEIRRGLDQSSNEAAANARVFRDSVEKLGLEIQDAIQKVLVLSEQVADFQYGPGDRQIPRLVEFYRGFRLVRYGGRIYGIRDALGDVDVLLGDMLLEAQYGGEDLIIGESPDGIKARVDALEAERRVQELSARLDEVEKCNAKA